MSKRFKRCFTGAFVILVGVLAWEILHPGEPTYRGKPVSEWVDELYNSHLAAPHRQVEEGDQEKAEDALRHLGTNALPTLVGMLRHKDSRAKTKLRALLVGQRWLPLGKVAPAGFYYTDGDYRLSAATAFDVLGPTAKPSVPDLLLFLKDADTNLQDYAASIIAVIDPQVAARAGLQ